jgi:hypothetical protein
LIRGTLTSIHMENRPGEAPGASKGENLDR